ncbi:MAG: efflux RND transporter periplasmic adaptor subunit [Bacteroidetes bacterium]|nr:efflux RND transporter periplasmic adaptor subunit [Bacteroidota bacterium]
MINKKRKNLWIYIAGVSVLALVAVAYFKGKNRKEGDKVALEEAQMRTIEERVSASGRIFPIVEVKISSDVSGEVVELYVQEGDSVVQGQVLAKINPDAYVSQVERGIAFVNSSKAQAANSRSQIENIKAQKEQIIAQLDNAREIHKRNEKLFKDGVISNADFQASQSNLKSLEANLRAADAGIRASQDAARGADYSVASAEASLKELRTSLNRTTIVAPESGIISLLNIEKGERVVGTIQMTGTEIMRIANLNAMEVRVDVSENDIPRVKLNDEVSVEVDAYLGRKFVGRVSQIANSSKNSASMGGAALATDQVTNFEVRIKIDPQSYADLVTSQRKYPFRPGMSAAVEIKTTIKENILTVPIQSVTTREKEGLAKKEAKSETDGGPSNKKIDELREVVFVYEKGDTIQMREVKTGIQDDSYIEILTGLKKGAKVVSAPYSLIFKKLKQGDKVIVVKEEELFTVEK